MEKTEKENPSFATRFQTGNMSWRRRSSYGPNPTFETPEDLWEACCEYFDYVENGRWDEEKAGFHQGEAVYAKVGKRVPFTLTGLAVFLDLTVANLNAYIEDNPVFQHLGPKIREIINDNKFSGASAGFFNQGIIARDLGLVDKQENTSTVNVQIQGKDASL